MNLNQQIRVKVSFWKLSAANFLAVPLFIFIFKVWLRSNGISFPLRGEVLLAIGLVVFLAAGNFLFSLFLGPEIQPDGISGVAQIRWEEIASVEKTIFGYVLRKKGLFASCVMLPRPFLLKNPEGVRRAIEKWAPRKEEFRALAAARRLRLNEEVQCNVVLSS